MTPTAFYSYLTSKGASVLNELRNDAHQSVVLAEHPRYGEGGVLTNNLKPTAMNHQDKTIVAWGVYYVPSREGKTFAGLKCELQQAFASQDSAIEYCNHLSMCGGLDDLHIGYRVYSMQWVPKGYKVN